MQGVVPASVLGGNPLLPRMMLGVVNRFAPAGHRPVPVQAASFAHHAAAYAKHDQEDAQEFLHYVLDTAHLVCPTCTAHPAAYLCSAAPSTSLLHAASTAPFASCAMTFRYT